MLWSSWARDASAGRLPPAMATSPGTAMPAGASAPSAAGDAIGAAEWVAVSVRSWLTPYVPTTMARAASRIPTARGDRRAGWRLERLIDPIVVASRAVVEVGCGGDPMGRPRGGGRRP